MSEIQRAISEDGCVVASAIDAGDMVSAIETFHKPSAVVTAALGRLAAAASLMGYDLKNETDRLTLRVDGNGPIGRMTAVADSHGNVKCCADNYLVELPLNAKGKLDVGAAVGAGTLSVIKDMGLKEPYAGTVPLTSGEIAEDLAVYFAESEQIPTVLSLGVLVAPDLSVVCAGGFLIQLLPYADENCIPILEHNTAAMPPVTELLQQGLTPADMALRCLEGLRPNLLDSGTPAYRCDCSRERTKGVLVSLGKEKLREMANEGEDIEVCCHFCNRKYLFSPSEIVTLAGE